MEINHTTRNLRIAPRKLRLVADKVRHMEISEAISILKLVPNKGAGMISKSLKAAVSMANDHNLDTKTLVIKRVGCNEGMKLKRLIGHSRGRMSPIMKHYSHLSLVIEGQEVTSKRQKVSSKKTIEATMSDEKSPNDIKE